MGGEDEGRDCAVDGGGADYEDRERVWGFSEVGRDYIV